ncbi:MAG TPA: CHAT domain-containing tetratricopeptide repeat protein, partial [Vicinamibacterales bacterium]
MAGVFTVAPAAGQQSAAPAPAAGSAKELLAAAQPLLDHSAYRAAVPLLERALVEADAGGDRALITSVLKALASGRWGLGDYAGSAALRQRQYDLARTMHDAAQERDALNGLGLDEYSQGQYAHALVEYQRALDADRAAPSVRGEGVIWANIGLVYRFQGRFDEARDAFEKSLGYRRSTGDEAGVAQTLNHLGIVYRAMSNFDRAIAYYMQSLDTRRRLGDRQGESQTLNNLANVYLDMGEAERAIDLYKQAEAIAGEIGYTVQIALAQANIANVLETFGRPQEALPRYESALATYRQIGRRSQIVDVLRSLGRVHAALGERDAAAAALDESRAVAHAIGEPDAEARTLDELGRLALDTDRPADALAHLNAANALVAGRRMPDVEYAVLADRAAALERLRRPTEAIRDLRASVAIIVDVRARLTTDLGKIGFLERREEVFAQLTRLLLRTGAPEAALEVAESGRARALADLLGSRDAAGRSAGWASLDRVRHAAALADAAEPAQQRPRDRDLSAAIDSLRRNDRELASLTAVDSPTIADIRKTAARLRGAIVEYLVGDAETYIWLVEASGRTHAATAAISHQQLAALVSSSASTRWRRLGSLLVDPIAAWLPSDPAAPVVIVPDGPLALVPFAAVEDPSGQPLVVRHTIVAAPAVSIFAYTAARARAVDAAHAAALVVADPLPPAGSQLEPLSGARDEARAIVTALGGGRTRLLEGADATETAVRALMPSYGLVHVAAHGLIAPDRPLASSLALASSDRDDGYLRVGEVFGLELHARLVVLSGCATGGGRVSGDGILGLARAFLYAGTATVIVSEWDVRDRATAFL